MARNHPRRVHSEIAGGRPQLSPEFMRRLEQRSAELGHQFSIVRRLAWQAPWLLRVKSGNVKFRMVPNPRAVAAE